MSAGNERSYVLNKPAGLFKYDFLLPTSIKELSSDIQQLTL